MDRIPGKADKKLLLFSLYSAYLIINHIVYSIMIKKNFTKDIYFHLKENNKHIFTFFCEKKIIPPMLHEKITIDKKKDDELFHRLLHINRIKLNQIILLFNYDTIYECTIHEKTNKEIILDLTAVYAIVEPTIQRVGFFPVLSKEYMEASLYAAAQAGINDIFFVHYEQAKEKINYERCKKIIISAAEQSKQFFLPRIHHEIYLKPQEMIDWCTKNSLPLISCLENGHKTVEAFSEYKLLPCAFTCGPEAGLSKIEEELLQEKSTTTITFGSVTLRSCDVLSLTSFLLRAT